MVIAHAGFDGQLSAEKLRAIFTGGSTVSLDGQVAQAVIAREGTPSRTAFLSGFLRKTDASFQASWVKAMFRERGARALMEVATDEDVVKAVATHPGAIGVVAAETGTAGVTRVGLR
jgi:ABC-type phosphate transport system substrate-binding protein